MSSIKYFSEPWSAMGKARAAVSLSERRDNGLDSSLTQSTDGRRASPQFICGWWPAISKLKLVARGLRIRGKEEKKSNKTVSEYNNNNTNKQHKQATAVIVKSKWEWLSSCKFFTYRVRCVCTMYMQTKVVSTFDVESESLVARPKSLSTFYSKGRQVKSSPIEECT